MGQKIQSAQKKSGLSRKLHQMETEVSYIWDLISKYEQTEITPFNETPLGHASIEAKLISVKKMIETIQDEANNYSEIFIPILGYQNQTSHLLKKVNEAQEHADELSEYVLELENWISFLDYSPSDADQEMFPEGFFKQLHPQSKQEDLKSGLHYYEQLEKYERCAQIQQWITPA